LESTTASLLQDAIALHRQGALAEAEDRYAQVLRSDPANADVLYRLAQISCQEGRLVEGVDLARRASPSIRAGRRRTSPRHGARPVGRAAVAQVADWRRNAKRPGRLLSRRPRAAHSPGPPRCHARLQLRCEGRDTPDAE